MHDFTIQWAGLVGRQQSPLIDRIPPRGVELWRDFWDTVRKQVRRINQEFWQLSRDMTKLVTSRVPSNPSPVIPSLYSEASAGNSFQEFYDKMRSTLEHEQQKLEKLSNNQIVAEVKSDQANLIDETDDESTKEELNRNVALRQQIQQEINVFGSIFDIMRAFMQRLRESATGAVRDILNPGLGNSNDAVTPGPDIKPQVDKLVSETLDSQRLINGQSQPVLLPNNRPSLNPRF